MSFCPSTVKLLFYAESNHSSCRSSPAVGLSLGSSFIILQRNFLSSFVSSGSSAIEKGFCFSFFWILHDGRKDMQSLIVRNLLVAHREGSKIISLLYQHMQWIGFIVGFKMRFENMPALSPNHAYELRIRVSRHNYCGNNDYMSSHLL
jgi:hypothetical protein